jgi:hypothetical protein
MIYETLNVKIIVMHPNKGLENMSECTVVPAAWVTLESGLEAQ